MSNKNILKMIILCTVLAIFTGAAIAQDDVPPNFPVALKGSVTIGGNAAPVDTIISAKVGDSLVGETKVQTPGTYGDKPNNRLPVSAEDGAKVDLYVNNIKVSSFTYYSKDAGTIKTENLGAPSQSSGTTGSSGSGGGGVSGAGGNPKATAIKQSVTTTTTTKESIQGTPATGNPVTTPGGEAPIFGWSTILGVFGLLAIGAIILFALKKMGKI